MSPQENPQQCRYHRFVIVCYDKPRFKDGINPYVKGNGPNGKDYESGLSAGQQHCRH